jgi:hypothetical protein
MSLGSSQLRVPMSARSVPVVGDQSSAYEGQFQLFGRTEQLGIELVQTGRTVFVVTYIDTVPPSNAIFGDLSSTVSAAIGKEA